MKSALLLVRDRPHYRFEAFHDGLRRAGFEVRLSNVGKKPCDVLVIWNRHGANHILAQRYEQAGRAVLVAENGYVGEDADGHHLFALALGHHNGAGLWPCRLDDGARFDRLGLAMAPWCDHGDGGDVLLLPQRGMGPMGVAMPHRWPRDAGTQAAANSRRRVRLRPHPSSVRLPTPLADDLSTAAVAYTWGSSAGIKALIAGVPVVYDFPAWIGGTAGIFGPAGLRKPRGDDVSRRGMLARLAWAQWSVSELASGEAFSEVLQCAR